MKNLLSILALSFQLSAFSATYYVNSSTGSDSNPGTSSGQAWQSFSVALGRLSSGDTLNCSGTWNITSTVTCSTANITIDGGGVSTLNIDANSIYGELRLSGSGLVWRGFALAQPYGAHNEGTAMVGLTGNNAFVYNLTVDGLAGNTTYDQVIWYCTGSGCTYSNIVVINSADHDCFRMWGVNNKITSCLFSNLTNPNWQTGPHADVVQCWWTGSGIWSNVIERCFFVNNDCATMQLKGTPDNIVCHPGEEGYWSIRNNIWKNCGGYQNISTWNFRFYNNLVINSGDGNGPTFIIPDTCLDYGRYHNNVFLDCQSFCGPNYTRTHNLFSSLDLDWEDDPYRIVTNKAACKFVNEAANDYRVQSGSVLLGSGTNLTTDPNMSVVDASGNTRPSTGAWSRGPYEYAYDATPPGGGSTNGGTINIQTLRVGTLHIGQ